MFELYVHNEMGYNYSVMSGTPPPLTPTPHADFSPNPHS